MRHTITVALFTLFMDINIKTLTLTPPTIHMGAEASKPDPLRLSGAITISPTIDLWSGVLVTATNMFQTKITTKILNSKMNNGNGEDSPMKEITPTKSFASTPDMTGENSGIVATARRIARILHFLSNKPNLVTTCCAAPRRKNSHKLPPNHSMTAPGSEGGNDTDTPNSWEELAEEEEKEILSPLGAVSPTDPNSTEEAAEPTTVVKAAAPSPTNSDTSRQSSLGSGVRRCLKQQLTISECLERGREKWAKDNKERSRRERDLRRNISEDNPSPQEPPLVESTTTSPTAASTELPEAARTLPPLPSSLPVVSSQDELVNPEDVPTPVPGGAKVTPVTHHPHADGESVATPGAAGDQNPGETQQSIKRRHRKRGGRNKRKGSTNPGKTETAGDDEQRSGDKNLNPFERLFDKGEPKATIKITRQGEGGNAHEAVARALLVAPEYFNILSLRPTPDGAIIEVADPDTAVPIVQSHLGREGWTVAVQPIWARYSFVAPGQLAGHAPGEGVDPSTIVRSLALRNTALFGLPTDSVRFVSHSWETVEGEGEGSTGSVRQRLRVWVDVSPEGESWFAQREYLMPTLVGAVRLRPAPRSRPRPDRS